MVYSQKRKQAELELAVKLDEELSKTKVALYVRVSTEEQANNGYSIDAQLNTLRNHCEISGKTIVEEYADNL